MVVNQIPNTNGVYRIALAWSNCYVLKQESSRRVWLIDTGLSGDRPDLLEALRHLNIEPRRVQAILLTHGHCDHAGSAAYFNREHGSQVYAHRDEIVHLNESRTPYGGLGWRALSHPVQSLVFRVGERRFPVERCSAITALEEGDQLSAPGGALRVIQSPGHSPGHTAYFRSSNGLMFSGDAVMNIVPHMVPGRRRSLG